mgnify:CR=1 FL=1
MRREVFDHERDETSVPRMTYRNQCRGRRFRTESYRRRLRLNERIEAARARFVAAGYHLSPSLEFDIACKEALPYEEIREIGRAHV